MIESLTNAILDAIPTDEQRKAIHENTAFKLHTFHNHIASNYNRASPVDQEVVKLEAERAVFFNYGTLDEFEFFTEHRIIRLKMLRARYPNIFQESSFIIFIITGLTTHSGFHYVLTMCKSHAPETIAELHAMEISAMYMSQFISDIATTNILPIQQLQHPYNRCTHNNSKQHIMSTRA